MSRSILACPSVPSKRAGHPDSPAQCGATAGWVGVAYVETGRTRRHERYVDFCPGGRPSPRSDELIAVVAQVWRTTAVPFAGVRHAAQSGVLQ